jgi:alpha-amylase
MDNPTMIQFFHWYLPEDGSLWEQFRNQCPGLTALGINRIWFPPATKGNKGSTSVGYDAYDLYDLGEFDQKGSIPTKYGTKEQYTMAIQEAHRNGMLILADVVLNHKAGADETEVVRAVKVDPKNRNKVISEVREIKAFTRFLFQGRNGKYSTFIWDSTCFTGVDRDAKNGEKGVFLFQNNPWEGWEDVLGDELGNYDYLMFSDVEFRNPLVKEEIQRWTEWLVATIRVDGFRVDAVKHISPEFLNEWIDQIRQGTPRPLFAVAEFWSGDHQLLMKYIKRTHKRFHLFDVPLHYRFYNASVQKKYDLRQMVHQTLASKQASLAVTFVENHDTQPFQALCSPVAAWFKPLAYAFILLRKQGIPCVFYADLYGASYIEKDKKGQDVRVELPIIKELVPLLICRKEKAYGKQRDYMEEAHCVGWTREGVAMKPGSGLAVLLCHWKIGQKEMDLGKRNAHKTFVDILGNSKREVVLDEKGRGRFDCPARKVSVWLQKETLKAI